jgi:hypothetical protein
MEYNTIVSDFNTKKNISTQTLYYGTKMKIKKAILFILPDTKSVNIKSKMLKNTKPTP